MHTQHMQLRNTLTCRKLQWLNQLDCIQPQLWPSDPTQCNPVLVFELWRRRGDLHWTFCRCFETYNLDDEPSASSSHSLNQAYHLPSVPCLLRKRFLFTDQESALPAGKRTIMTSIEDVYQLLLLAAPNFDHLWNLLHQKLTNQELAKLLEKFEPENGSPHVGKIPQEKLGPVMPFESRSMLCHAIYMLHWHNHNRSVSAMRGHRVCRIGEGAASKVALRQWSGEACRHIDHTSSCNHARGTAWRCGIFLIGLVAHPQPPTPNLAVQIQCSRWPCMAERAGEG